MIRVTAELQLSALDREFDDAVVELWYERVAPALAELDEIARSNGLIRTYGAEAVKSLGMPSATALIVGATTGDWTSGTLAGMANLAIEASVRAAATRKAHRSRLHNPYYFLHSTGNQLGGR